jgi:S-phase kinase-associated protein 1
VKLKSKQEEIFEVEKEVACRSITVKNMVDDTGMDVPVPLPMVDSKILVCGAARPAQTYPAPALLVRARPGAWVGAT